MTRFWTEYLTIQVLLKAKSSRRFVVCPMHKFPFLVLKQVKMQTSFVNMQNPLITMQPLLLQCQNTSLYQEIPLSVGYEPLENLTRVPLPLRGEPSSPYFSAWTVQTCLISLAFSLLLFKYISTSWVSTSPPTIATLKAPPQVPYIIPVVGNLLSYLLDAAQLASTIR